MNSVLTVFSLILCAFVVLAVPTLVTPYAPVYGVVSAFDTSKAFILCAFLATAVGFIALRQGANGPFLARLFVAALLVRVLLGTLIFVFNGQEFFGGDAITYDYYGLIQLKAWLGDRYFQNVIKGYVGGQEAAGWGMIYLVGGLYGLLGRNLLAVQFINAVMGATTSVVVFLIAFQIFNNIKVARVAAIAVAFYPSLVLWSSQGLKDGPIVFFLALSFLATLKLSEKFKFRYMAILVCSLFSLLSLRFYVFYMVTAAVAGAFVFGMQKVTATSFMRQFAIFITLGLALTYLGVTRYASVHLGNFASLERMQRSRNDAATSAKSGFGREVDVSTTEGALNTIPVGLLYLLFAPFPWQLASLRQSITLPEMLIWWASFPLLILGLWFSVKYRLRQISPILTFTVMLSIAYSLFQGNVGTAYRQRSQLLVFYFIFVAVGYVLLLEKREERKRRDLAEQAPTRARIATSPSPQR